MAKLLKITSTNGVDIVIIAVTDEYKHLEVIDQVERAEIADFRGEIYIGDVADIPDQFVELNRPFVG